MRRDERYRAEAQRYEDGQAMLNRSTRTRDATKVEEVSIYFPPDAKWSAACSTLVSRLMAKMAAGCSPC